MATTSTPLTDRTALVTGASSGIGRATALAMAREGADVVLCARRVEPLDELAANIEADHGVGALAIGTDVTDYESVEATVDRSVDRFGGLDIVVCNAGVGSSKPDRVEEMPIDEFDRVTRTNIDGMFHTAHVALPHLRRSAGNMIFVGSFTGKFPRAGSPVYAATKWWTQGFALSLDGHTGSEVAVSVINPSGVRTAFGSETPAPPQKDRYAPGEAAEPEDVAETILFAATQAPPNNVSELNYYLRDKLRSF